MKLTASTLFVCLAAAASVALIGTSVLRLDGSAGEGAATRNARDLLVATVAEVPGELLQPITRDPTLDAEKVELGHELFVDTRLSKDETLSCASCHQEEHGGADAAQFSTGIGGQLTAVNSPSVRNGRFKVAQFWNGRAATLEEQVDGPLQNPAEMGMTWDETLRRLRADLSYVRAAREIYGQPLSPALVRDAIATYERSLVSAGSRFDAFLRGNGAALTADEQAGYSLFKQLGCVSCHQGAAVGGTMFQRFGQFGDYFADRGSIQPADLGRFNVTRAEQDRYVFKVPSLRDVAETAPYFHDGSAETLEEAISVMARYQLGRLIGADDVARIAKFLRTLSGGPAEAAS
jgi:cytochrome c peroxidase